jgi:quercetin dioxygenase-like cupin family protein
MIVIRAHESRLTRTPNASMFTLASPTLGGATLAMWRVEMPASAAGPLHTIDVEQIWTVERGGATVRLGGGDHTLREGDTIILPAGQLRGIQAHEETGLAALVAAHPGGQATLASGEERGVVPWSV